MATTQSTPEHSPRRFPLLALIILLVLIGLALFGDKGVLRALQSGRQKAELTAEVARLEQENTALKREIEALRNDRRTIESIARKELGMVKEDELVYQFRSAPQIKSSKAAASEPADGSR